MHVDEPLEEYSPATHTVHVDEELAEYLPATHVVHADEGLAEYVPAKQFAHTLAPDGDTSSHGTVTCDDFSNDHVPVKPLRVTEPSDVNVTLRNPVDELYTLDGLRDPPPYLRMRSDDPHAAVSHL